MNEQGTEFIRFTRRGGGIWRLETRLVAADVVVNVEFEFTRDPRSPIWKAERLAMQAAHEAIGEWLRLQPGQGE